MKIQESLAKEVARLSKMVPTGLSDHKRSLGGSKCKPKQLQLNRAFATAMRKPRELVLRRSLARAKCKPSSN